MNMSETGSLKAIILHRDLPVHFPHRVCISEVPNLVPEIMIGNKT